MKTSRPRPNLHSSVRKSRKSVAARLSIKAASGLLSKGLVAFVAGVMLLASSPKIIAQDSRLQQSSSPAVREDVSKDGGTRGDVANVVVASSEDYRIGPNDVLEIKVINAPELSGTFMVSAAGLIPMPYIGDMKVAQKTPQEVAGFIADNLRGDYLKNPRVTVTVTQYNSRSFFIQGAVRTPGVYQIRGNASLFKLITVAGGLTDTHGSTAFIIRQVKPESSSVSASSSTDDNEKYELKKVNINGLYKGDFEQNVIIEPGDLVNIPPIDVFFVAGEVRRPGSFPLKDGTTLRQAISLAQGTTFEAAKDRGVIFREDEKGKRKDIKIDIAAVMAGKKEDLAIQANDIIMIPNSRSKTIGGALLRALGMATIQRGIPVY